MKNPQWPWLPISELFNINAGKTMSAAARNGAFQIPFLRTSNVFWDEIDLSQLDQMSIEPRELEKKKLAVGDLLVCEGGEIGRCAIWDGQVDIISFQNHLHRLRPARDDVVPRFYVYFLQSAFTQLGIFEGAGNKTTIPNLSRNRLAALEVPKPSFEEQQGIATALSSVRAAIKINEQLLLTAQELKRAAMREVFTRGLRGEAQKQTEIGLVPESWTYTSLGQLCSSPESKIQTGPFGSQLHAHEYIIDGIPVVNPTHLAGNRINHENIPTISEERAQSLSRHRLKTGDILFARRGEIGRLGLVGIQETGWVCGTGCFVVRVRNTEIYNPYLPYFFGTEPIVKWLLTNAAGTVMPNLNNTVLGRLPVAFPLLEEQTQIVILLSTIDDKITLHKRKKAALEALFTSLLHQLMTGKIRVADLDLAALSQPQTEAA